MKPLEGILVIDLTHAVAGPFCTRQLLLHGADVLKVERPGGGDDFRARGRTFDALNAGKRSLALDLKDGASRRRLLELVTGADVLVENFRPGVMDALDLGWEALRAANPRLVACSITGFGQAGGLSQAPAIEWSVQAASGMTSTYVDPAGDPLRLGLSVLDPFTGYKAFAEILAALRERDRTGAGTHLDVAMIDAAFTLMWPQVVESLGDPAAPPRLGRRGTMARFQTADGVLFVAALQQRWFESVCLEAGAADLVADPRFATPEARAADPDAVFAALQERLRHLSGRRLEPRLNALGVPAAVVRSVAEAAASPAVAERGLVEGWDRPGPRLGGG